MKYQINLLSKREETIIDRLIYFSLNYLRYILVVTQIVVICVFFYKFYVDQRIIDLKESVDQKKEIIDVSQPLLNEAKMVDFKLKQASDVLTRQKNMLLMIVYIKDSFPQDLILTKFIMTESGVKMEGTTNKISVIQAFYNHFKTESKFAQVNLINMKRTETGYEFNLELSGFKVTKNG